MPTKINKETININNSLEVLNQNIKELETSLTSLKEDQNILKSKIKPCKKPYTDIQAKIAATTTKTRAYLGTSHFNITSGTWTTVHIDAIDFDPDNNFSTGNYWYTVPESGYYLTAYCVKWAVGLPTNTTVGSGIYENGIIIGDTMGELNISPGYCSVGGIDVFYFTIDRHITMKGYQNSGSNQRINYYNKASTYILFKKLL